MIAFDEYIWRISSALDGGRELVHREHDVNFSVDSFNDIKAVKHMIASLIGQDAKCPDSDQLIVLPYSYADSRLIWAIASTGADSAEYYSVLLVPIR